MAESVGGVGWRTAPVGATPQIGARGVSWRCLLAVSLGGVCWRCRRAVSLVGPHQLGPPPELGLAVSAGGLRWRCLLAVSVGGVCWRTGLKPWRFRLNSFPASRLQATPTDVFRIAIPAQVLGGLAWRSQLAVSLGGVSWRTGLQPGRFRLNSFPANRLQATPTDVFRIAIPAQVLGGLAWRSQLAVSAGGVGWRNRLLDRTNWGHPPNSGWRCQLAVSVGGVGWRTAPVGATPQIGACRNAPVTSWGHPPNWGWRCRLAVSVGGLRWRCRLADRVTAMAIPP